MPNSYSLPRHGTRPKRGCSFWPIITAPGCSPVKSAPVNPPPPAASPPRSIPTCIRSSTCTGPPDRRWICSAHCRSDLVRQISGAIVRLKQSKKQHPILICDEAQLLCHSALQQLPLLLNFDMDSSRYLT